MLQYGFLRAYFFRMLSLKVIQRFQSNYEIYHEIPPDHSTVTVALISRSTRTRRHFETLSVQRRCIRV